MVADIDCEHFTILPIFTTCFIALSFCLMFQ